MARGITEIDVHTAADALVANGERPTVERIRAHLGTGSPNTVTRWLETWWKNLGLRLQPKRPDLTDAPAVLAELAGQWWTLALGHARESVLEELAGARQALSRECDELRLQKQNFAEEASELHAAVRASAQAEHVALTQVAELRQLVDQLQAQLSDSAQQRTAADQRLGHTEAARQALEVRIQELQELARSERVSLAEHVKAVENRALVDVDRARQEIKTLRAQLLAVTKDGASQQARASTQMEALRTSTATAERELAVQRTRADGLEQELERLQGLSAAFEKALKSAATAKTDRPAIRRKPKEVLGHSKLRTKNQ